MTTDHRTPPVTVLVVDDQQSYRDAARFVIEMSDGFKLAGMAESGEEGVGMAEGLHPDLVLMDLNLPGIDGLEATRRIVDRVPGIGVIVFSTHSAEDYEQRAIDAGAMGFIAKAELGPDTLTELWGTARMGPDLT